MKNHRNALLCGLAPLLLVAAATAQTRGVGMLNRSFVTNGGALVFPPPLTACPPPIPLAPGVPVTFRVQSAAAGMPVMLFLDVGPTVPGAVCLAPAPVGIPPCLGAPCGPGTNQSLDLAAPFMATIAGVTAVRPGGGGYFVVPFTPPVAPLGLQLSVQAIITDPTVPSGFIITNAFSVLI